MEIYRYNQATAWSDIEPETVDEMLFAIVCKKEKPFKKKK
jgi:hypothetical protein